MDNIRADYEEQLLDPGTLVQAISDARSQWVPLAFLAIVLAFATLAYGAVHTWAYSLVQLSLMVAGCLWLGRWAWTLSRQETVSLTLVSVPLYSFILCLTVWIGFQLIPLPLALVSWLSPQAAYIRELGSVAAPAWAPLSLNPFATRLGLFHFFSCVVVFCLTLTALQRQKEIIGFILFLGAVGLFEVVYGASQIYARPPRIWGWKNIYGSVRLNGTFINPDHLAVWLEMAFFLVLGLFLALKPDAARHGTATRRDRDAWKRWILDHRTMEKYIKRFLILLLVLVLASGLVLTQSRGGVWAGLVTLATVFFLERARHKDQAPWAAGLLFMGSLIAYIFFVSGGVDLSRLGDLAGNESRFAMYAGTLAMVRDFLLTGVGLGAFADVFTIYQDPSLLNHWIDYPHSDWLQALAELGLPGFGLILGGYLVFMYYLWNCWRQRQDRFALGVGLGCLGALLCVSFHAAVDFPLHIPANSLMLAAVMALGVVAVHYHRHPWERLAYRTISLFRPLPGRLALFLPLTLAGLLLVLAVPIWNHWAAERLAPTLPDSTRRKVEVEPEAIMRAMAKSPAHAAYPALLAARLEEIMAGEPAEEPPPDILPDLPERSEPPRPDYGREIISLYEQALRLAPSQYRLHHALGWALLQYGEPGEQPRGLQALATAARLFPHNGFLQLSYGAGLLYLSKLAPEVLPPDWPALATQALERALMQEAQFTSQVSALLEQYPEFVPIWIQSLTMDSP